MVFVGFKSKVVALDRDSGDLVWVWESPNGRGYVAVLVDGDRVIASVQGYTYCLAPWDGSILWQNPLSGMGCGVPCLASARGCTAAHYVLQAAAEEEEKRARHARGAHPPP
jgi:outer membrane protein assembly factor BamB